MQYAAHHTSIPVPRIRQTYHLRQGLFIAMDYIQGESLQDVWPRLSPAEKTHTIAQIWRCLSQLHACRPPSALGTITAASIGGGPVRDGALSLGESGPQEVGPFIRADDFAAVVADKKHFVGFHLQPTEVAFVHADICPRNIILGRDGNLWFIDWEFAGWWPICRWLFSLLSIRSMRRHCGRDAGLTNLRGKKKKWLRRLGASEVGICGFPSHT